MKPRLPYLTLLTAALLLTAGCRSMTRPEALVDVRELARLSVCNSPSLRPAVTLLADADALLAWQNARGVQLLDPQQPAPVGPYAVAELGASNHGGATLVISRHARLDGSTLSLSASVIGGSAEHGAEMLTSPCVLVKLPPGDYRSVDLRDSGDRGLADSDSPPPPVPAARPAQ